MRNLSNIEAAISHLLDTKSVNLYDSNNQHGLVYVNFLPFQKVWVCLETFEESKDAPPPYTKDISRAHHSLGEGWVTSHIFAFLSNLKFHL